MITPQDLDQFTGTETWHRHPFNRRLLHTDGVEYFAKEAGAYWFIDLIAIGADGKRGPVPYAMPNKDGFGVVLLNVKDEKATVEVRSDYDENDATCGTSLFKQKIGYTTCPEGLWKFYLQHDGENTVLMCASEY